MIFPAGILFGIKKCGFFSISAAVLSSFPALFSPCFPPLFPLFSPSFPPLSPLFPTLLSHSSYPALISRSISQFPLIFSESLSLSGMPGLVPARRHFLGKDPFHVL